MPTRTAQGRICKGLETTDTAFHFIGSIFKNYFQGFAEAGMGHSSVRPPENNKAREDEDERK